MCPNFGVRSAAAAPGPGAGAVRTLNSLEPFTENEDASDQSLYDSFIELPFKLSNLTYKPACNEPPKTREATRVHNFIFFMLRIFNGEGTSTEKLI
jgi:hypothetical protein